MFLRQYLKFQLAFEKKYGAKNKEGEVNTGGKNGSVYLPCGCPHQEIQVASSHCLCHKPPK